MVHALEKNCVSGSVFLSVGSGIGRYFSIGGMGTGHAEAQLERTSCCRISLATLKIMQIYAITSAVRWLLCGNR